MRTIDEVRDILKTKSNEFYIDSIFSKYDNGYNKIFCVCKCMLDESHSSWTAPLPNLKRGTGCPKCGYDKMKIFQSTPKHGESIFEKRKDLIKYLKYPSDSHKYCHSSRSRLCLVCPDCGSERDDMTMNTLSKQGFSCKICSDGISVPEKFVMGIFKQAEITFETQKIFEWSERKRYDFYIASLNMIVEVHGLQHYVDWNKGRSLEEEQENDMLKERLAKENSIGHYIVIDCRKSEFEWLRENCEMSIKPYLNLSEINWNEIFSNAHSSLKLKVWEAWNNKSEHETTTTIGSKIGLSQGSMIKYLKAGNCVGKCYYDASVERKKSGPINVKKKMRSVRQYTINKVFIKEWDSIASVTKCTNINGSHISCCCRNKRKTVGGFIWKYTNDLTGIAELEQTN